MLANVQRAMAIAAKLNRLTFNDTEKFGHCSASKQERLIRSCLFAPSHSEIWI
jgi:hypothetical protein